MEANQQTQQQQQPAQKPVAAAPAVLVSTILEEDEECSELPGARDGAAAGPGELLLPHPPGLWVNIKTRVPSSDSGGSSSIASRASSPLAAPLAAACDTAAADEVAAAADATATILLGEQPAVDTPAAAAVARVAEHQTAAAVAASRPQLAAAAAPISGRSLGWKVQNYLIIPLCLPLIAAWWLLALLAAACVTFTVFPSLLLARRLYWACPFIPYIWASKGLRARVGLVGSWLLRLQFEGAHCMTVLARLFSLPLRPHLPSCYIIGFPKCGTTSLAAYLRQHPAVSGLSGMPGDEIFSKESHFFGGILGRSTTTSAMLYRSFFPTVLTRWWSEAVLGADRWMCFDACPTFACQPHVAARVRAITPAAKLVVMVRDPSAGVFSAEMMLRNMGVPLSWSLSVPLRPQGEEACDPRFQFDASDEEFWAKLEALPADAPLPQDLPERFYFKLHSYLMAGRFADRLAPWVREFGADNVLLVDYAAFVADPEQQVRRMLQFVGADTNLYRFRQQPARMVGDYKGAKIDPGVATWLNETWFADSNAVLADMMAAAAAEHKS